MTNEEAIARIREHMIIHKNKESRAIYITEALELAIKALDQQTCDDAISREAVLEYIEGSEAELGHSSENELVCQDIKNLPSVTPQPRWIPVSEGLPKANGRYYVTRGLNACGSLWNRVYIVNYSDLMGLKSEKIWWSGNVGKSDFERIDDVIAWMPLPKPYKAESKE